MLSKQPYSRQKVSRTKSVLPPFEKGKNGIAFTNSCKSSKKTEYNSDDLPTDQHFDILEQMKKMFVFKLEMRPFKAILWISYKRSLSKYSKLHF